MRRKEDLRSTPEFDPVTKKTVYRGAASGARFKRVQEKLVRQGKFKAERGDIIALLLPWTCDSRAHLNLRAQWWRRLPNVVGGCCTHVCCCEH